MSEFVTSLINVVSFLLTIAAVFYIAFTVGKRLNGPKFYLIGTRWKLYQHPDWQFETHTEKGFLSTILNEYKAFDDREIHITFIRSISEDEFKKLNKEVEDIKGLTL